MWVALGIVAHYAMWLAMHDEEILVRLIASALVYLGLLKVSPHAARVWLCAGGALAGAFLLGTTALSLLMSFPSRWSVLGLSIGATLAFLASGLLIGFGSYTAGPSPRSAEKVSQDKKRRRQS